MKKRKFFALFLTLSILLCQTVFVLPVRADGIIMEENFNSRLATDSVQTGGNIFSIQSGSNANSKLEYASVGENNMALKLTVPKEETSAVGVSFRWTKVESGTVSVSFDFWSGNHSGYVQKLLVQDYDGRDITGGRSAGDKLTDRDDGTNTLVSSIGSTPIHIEYILTCSDTGVNAYDVLVNGTPKYTEQTPKNVTRTNVGRLAFRVIGTPSGATSGSASGDGIYYLDNIVVKTVETAATVTQTVPVNGGSAAEGSSTASVSFSSPLSSVSGESITVVKNGVTLADSAFTAAIDTADNTQMNLSFTDPFAEGDRFCITVNKSVAGLAEDYSFEFIVIPQDAAFEGFEAQTAGSAPTGIADRSLSLEKNDGTVTVEANPDSGHNAVKIIAKNQQDNKTTGFICNLASASWTTGIAELSYDLRIDNNSSTLQQIFGDSDGNQTGVPCIYQNGDNFYLRDATDTQLFTLADVTGKNARIRFVVDMEAKEYQVFINGVKKATGVYTRSNVRRFTFRTRNMAQQATNTNGTAEGDGIYWIDNISYRHYEKPFAVESCTIAAGCELDVLDTPIQVTLSKAANPTTVTKGNITLFKNGVQVAEDLYELSCSADNRVITITPDEGLVYSASYRIVMGTGIQSASAESLPAWEVSFTTGEDPFDGFRIEAFAGDNPVGDINEVKGQTITLRITLNPSLSAGQYVFIGGCKSGADELRSAAASPSSEHSGSSFDVPLAIPADIDASGYIVGYLWTGTEELIPLAPPATLLKNE